MAYDSPQQRDRGLERARRIKVGLVSAGVVGSLGFAGLAGWSTVSARYAQQSAASESTTNEQDQSFSQWLASRNPLGGHDATEEGGEGSGDDGEQQLPANQAPLNLGPGTGGAPAHGSTGGS